MNNFNYDNVSTSFDRGYTLHEHYDDFGLINMNGRLYDPLVGRMLSPDIVIQDEQNSQAYNRYSYCFNNAVITLTNSMGMEVYTQNVHGERGQNVINLQKLPVGVYILTIKCEEHRLTEKVVVTR